jgi:hypothetical protein
VKVCVERYKMAIILVIYRNKLLPGSAIMKASSYDGNRNRFHIRMGDMLWSLQVYGLKLVYAVL